MQRLHQKHPALHFQLAHADPFCDSPGLKSSPASRALGNAFATTSATLTLTFTFTGSRGTPAFTENDSGVERRQRSLRLIHAAEITLPAAYVTLQVAELTLQAVEMTAEINARCGDDSGG
jgi:hypothetical protein